MHPTKKTFEDVLIVFRQKYVKQESQATAKHKWHKLSFRPYSRSLSDFLEEFNDHVDEALGYNAQHTIHSLFYAKLPLYLKRSINLVYLEKGTYDQIVANLQTYLELSGLENDGKLPLLTMTAAPPNDNPKRTEQSQSVCHCCEKLGQFIRNCR